MPILTVSSTPHIFDPPLSSDNDSLERVKKRHFSGQPFDPFRLSLSAYCQIVIIIRLSVRSSHDSPRSGRSLRITSNARYLPFLEAYLLTLLEFYVAISILTPRFVPSVFPKQLGPL